MYQDLGNMVEVSLFANSEQDPNNWWDRSLWSVAKGDVEDNDSHYWNICVHSSEDLRANTYGIVNTGSFTSFSDRENQDDARSAL